MTYDNNYSDSFRINIRNDVISCITVLDIVIFLNETLVVMSFLSRIKESSVTSFEVPLITPTLTRFLEYIYICTIHALLYQPHDFHPVHFYMI